MSKARAIEDQRILVVTWTFLHSKEGLESAAAVLDMIARMVETRFTPVCIVSAAIRAGRSQQQGPHEHSTGDIIPLQLKGRFPSA